MATHRGMGVKMADVMGATMLMSDSGWSSDSRSSTRAMPVFWIPVSMATVKTCWRGRRQTKATSPPSMKPRYGSKAAVSSTCNIVVESWSKHLWKSCSIKLLLNSSRQSIYGNPDPQNYVFVDSLLHKHKLLKSCTFFVNVFVDVHVLLRSCGVIVNVFVDLLLQILPLLHALWISCSTNTCY